MIELLLDSPPFVLQLPFSFLSRGLTITSSQSPRRTSRQRPPSNRSAVRQSSNRSRLHSTSTMIVHSDTDEDEAHHAVKPESEAPSGLHPGPMTRTRKARDAQLQLGVGRPPVAGGSAPRTVTRSVSIAKAVRSRSGRGAKPPPAPVVEGWSGPFHFPCHLPFSDQFSISCAGLCLCASLVTRDLNRTPPGTPEDAPQPPSNHGTSQPRTIENGRIRRASTMNINTDQADVRQIVEEQVCIPPSPSLLSHTSVGTAPTTHGCIAAEATPATGISPFSRSSRTK